MARANSISPCPPGDQPRAARRARVTIDLRGHGPALNAIALSKHTSVAALVRTVLGDWLKSRSVAETEEGAVSAALDVPVPLQKGGDALKVTLRMPVAQALRLAQQARAAELAQGVYVARLIDALPAFPAPPDLRENRAALVRSTATLAALSGDLRYPPENPRY